jgi:hypothetical protein
MNRMLGIKRVELPKLRRPFFFVLPRKTGKGFFVECFNGFNLSVRKRGKFVCPSPFRKAPVSPVQVSVRHGLSQEQREKPGALPSRNP